MSSQTASSRRSSSASSKWRKSTVRSVEQVKKKEPKTTELLRAHRGPLRALFACLEARCREKRENKEEESRHFFWEHEVGLVKSWRDDWACPLGWTTARSRTIDSDDVLDAATRWGGGGSRAAERARKALDRSTTRWSYIRFERFFAAWAGDDLAGKLADVADACCKSLRASCVARLDLRAPWWLLGRGEMSTFGASRADDSELQAIRDAAFRDLKMGGGGSDNRAWSVGDFYALSRDAGLLGEALSPSALLSTFEQSQSLLDPILIFRDILEKLAALWWQGEGGETNFSSHQRIQSTGQYIQKNNRRSGGSLNNTRDGFEDDDVDAVKFASLFETTTDMATACLLVERILPLLACRAPLKSRSSSRLFVDRESLSVARDHDMALRCLFVAYCDAHDGRIAPLSLLHFARDFRLLAADRFAPSSVVDAARQAKQPNHIDSDEVKGLRWPEFVETLFRLADARGESLSALLSLMDPDGRVFFVGDSNAIAPTPDFPRPKSTKRSTAAAVEEQQKQRTSKSTGTTTLKNKVPSSPKKKEISPRKKEDLRRHEIVPVITGDALMDDRHRILQRLATRRSLVEAAEATRILAAKDKNDDLDVIAASLANAANIEEESFFTEPKADAGTQVDFFDDDALQWPPPPSQSPDDIWADDDDDEERIREAIATQQKAAVEDEPLVLEPLPEEPEKKEPRPVIVEEKKNRPSLGTMRRCAATEIQKVSRGFSLRRRLALLRDRLTMGLSTTTTTTTTVTTTVDTKEKPPKLQEDTEEDERAVIHAFALAALLGDGSPRRVARARALVETLKDLPSHHETTKKAEDLVVAVDERGTSQHHRQHYSILRSSGTTVATMSKKQPTLDELEAQLRDALARVALEEKWRVSDAGADDAKKQAALLSAQVEKHPGFEARQAAEAAKWDMRERPANLAALAALRELIPANIASSDKPTVTQGLARAVGVSPDDPKLAPLVDRIWSQRILWLVHFDKAAIARIHVADLRARYTFADLDPVELRACYAALPDTFENDDDEVKLKWKMGLRMKLVEILDDLDPTRYSARNYFNGSPTNNHNPLAAGASQNGAKVYHRWNEQGTRVGHAAYDVLDDAAKAAQQKKQQPASDDLQFSEDDDDDDDAHQRGMSSAAAAPHHDVDHHQPTRERRPGGRHVWRECWDDNYRRCYYFNDETGASQWHEPEDDYEPLPEEELHRHQVPDDDKEPSPRAGKVPSPEEVEKRKKDALRGAAADYLNAIHDPGSLRGAASQYLDAVHGDRDLMSPLSDEVQPRKPMQTLQERFAQVDDDDDDDDLFHRLH